MKPIYRFDPISRISWLEFDGKPDQDTIDLLKKEGWRWSGYRKQWRTNRRYAKPPAGIEYQDGEECDYASERPDRLASASKRAETRSEEAYNRSNDLVKDIPFGQPILVGHHSQHRHEKTLERSRTAMDKSVEEQKKAEHLEYKARSSARHQAYKERPDVIFRRIKRLKADITSIRNQMKHEPWGLWDARQQKDEAKIAELMKAWEASNQRQEEKIKLIEAEIAENEAALAEVGGLLTDKLNIEVGDIILAWPGECKVEKINKRNGIIMSYTCQPHEGLSVTYNPKRVIKVDEVKGLLRKADGTVVSERKVRAYIAPEPKEERTFAVEQVQTMEVYDNRTSLFPTPKALAEQLAQEIPQNAYWILEPSAGTGGLADAAVHVLFERGQNSRIHCCEILPQLCRNLAERGYQIVGEDFLEYKPADIRYDVCLMNPPFKNTDWVDHVEHALELLKPGGTLLAIVPAGFKFREDKRIKEFRALVEECGDWWDLPEDSFVESGTAVRTVMLSMVKPAEREVEAIEPLATVTLEQSTLW